jgi:hypothetical protein
MFAKAQKLRRADLDQSGTLTTKISTAIKRYICYQIHRQLSRPRCNAVHDLCSDAIGVSRHSQGIPEALKF